MKRSLRQRAAALIWLIAFVLGTAGEGIGLLSCPHHVAANGEPAAAHFQHAGHAKADSPENPRLIAGGCAGRVASAAQEAPTHEHDGVVPCTCGPTCQATMATALAIVPRTEPVPTAVIESQLTPAGEAAPAAPRPPYSLPFAQAPPHHG